jgi:hypothetical protein
MAIFNVMVQLMGMGGGMHKGMSIAAGVAGIGALV